MEVIEGEKPLEKAMHRTWALPSRTYCKERRPSLSGSSGSAASVLASVSSLQVEENSSRPTANGRDVLPLHKSGAT